MAVASAGPYASLQTDNHASTPPLSFLQAGCPSCRPTNIVKALKAVNYITLHYWQLWICADNYSVKLCGRCCSYQVALQAAFDSRVNIRKEVMELEVSERILALKIHKKELTLGRLSQLVDEADHCRVQ